MQSSIDTDDMDDQEAHEIYRNACKGFYVGMAVVVLEAARLLLALVF